MATSSSNPPISERSLNLLFVIKSLDSRGGGAERVLADVGAELAKRGHHLTILSFDPPGSADFYSVDPPIVRLRVGVGNVRGRSRVGETIRRIVALRKAANELKPDVAIGWMHSGYVPLALALAGTGLPLIASEHIDYSHYRTVPFEGVMIRLLVGRFARMTAISDRVRSGFPAALRDKMVVVPNPVTTAPDQLSDPVGGAQKTLLSVGRLFAQKDHRTLIAAFARLAPQHPQWRLRIVGEGALRPELERQIEDFGLGSRVDLPGVIQDISAEYRGAQLFVLPSRYESFGLATAEALAHGLPAVGFADCPGTNEIIEHEVNGLLAQGPDRVTALADALDMLMDSPALRRAYGAAGPKSVERFSLSAIASRWESLLRQVTISLSDRGDLTGNLNPSTEDGGLRSATVR
jgi:glycosyltransferase involved in cell wall biosynthesis